ncbi:MAG: DUF362 domain-containing protein [Acetivibrionales bacterium]
MNRVSIIRCDSYKEETVVSALKETFNSLGGIEKYVKPGMKVVIKANLLMKKNPSSATTTHPCIVKSLTELIMKAGASSVILADSPGGPYTEKLLNGVYSACGMKKVSEETGLKLNYDLSEVEVENPSGKYLKKVTILKPIVDADLVINIPKLKTHGMMVFTGAVKNMFGAVPGLLKAEYHLKMAQYDEFANALIDIFLCVKPSLNIMDAVVAMEGHGPSAGNPRHMGLILASEDAFSLDLAALKIININPLDVPVMRNAKERGLWDDSRDDLQFVGETLESVRINDFDTPQLESLRDIQFLDNKYLKGFLEGLKPKPVFDYAKCTGCANCASSCPAQIIHMRDKKPCADLSKCIRCFCCQELCPAKAISIRRPVAWSIAFKVGAFFAGIIMNLRKK